MIINHNGNRFICIKAAHVLPSDTSLTHDIDIFASVTPDNIKRSCNINVAYQVKVFPLISTKKPTNSLTAQKWDRRVVRCKSQVSAPHSVRIQTCNLDPRNNMTFTTFRNTPLVKNSHSYVQVKSLVQSTYA